MADYDELAPLYNARGLNLLAVDYRGYGRSSGVPGVAAMMADCHRILDYCQDWLKRNAYTGPLILMGRSLGSASVLELAATHPNRIQGLIIESGFAYAAPCCACWASIRNGSASKRRPVLLIWIKSRSITAPR